MALVPVLLFGPGLLRLANRYVLRRAVSMRLRVPQKGICLLVAFVMLLGPESFHNLSQAEVQYANLSTASWAQGRRGGVGEAAPKGQARVKQPRSEANRISSSEHQCPYVPRCIPNGTCPVRSLVSLP